MSTYGQRYPYAAQGQVSARVDIRLVLAVDYGTTFSGVATSTTTLSPNTAILNRINPINVWGDKQGNSESKLPSVISYSRSVKGSEQWGNSLSEGSITMAHTKLQLQVDRSADELDRVLESLEGMKNLELRHVRDSDLLPVFTWKGSEEIVRDYLTKLFEALLPAMPTFTMEIRKRTPTDLVITIPAGWQYEAKNSLFRALTGAGFNRDTFPALQDVLMVSEPEAAAIYTARVCKEEVGGDFLKIGEVFVICDAGGGTVDLVSYQVKALEPVLRIIRETMASSRKCGSAFIDLAFKSWIRGLLGKDYDKIDGEQVSNRISSHNTEGKAMRSLMANFRTLKDSFRKGIGALKLDLPEPLDKFHDGRCIDQGEVTIEEDVMKGFFDPLINSIVQMIDGQIRQVEVRQRRVRNVFLVGGFAQSEYLRDAITTSLLARGDITLRIPPESRTAVMRGAAILGIEKPQDGNVMRMVGCPRSFGIVVHTSFSNAYSSSENVAKNPYTGKLEAQEELVWLIKKHDLIFVHEPTIIKRALTFEFNAEGIPHGSTPLYSYPDDDLPDKISGTRAEMHSCHTLSYDLRDKHISRFTRHHGRKGVHYSTNLDLELSLTTKSLQVNLTWENDILAQVTISL